MHGHTPASFRQVPLLHKRIASDWIESSQMGPFAAARSMLPHLSRKAQYERIFPAETRQRTGG